MVSVTSVLRSVVASVIRSTRSRQTTPPEAAAELGRDGSTATVEIDPESIGAVRMTYAPSTDGNPDPGEIVWTWVPYEERDGRGKDRPVLLVAGESEGTLLAVQLTSKPRPNDVDYVPIGRGRWDVENRPSWVDLDRVFRVHPNGMRREAAALDSSSFGDVIEALSARYGWH